MRKTFLVLASVALAMVVAGGVAWAATIKCPNTRTSSGSPICEGTAKADRMLGTSRHDEMRGKKGGDTMYGRGGEYDFMLGNPGPDRMFGGPARDHIEGGPGVDKLYGNEGNNDDIFTGTLVSLGRDEGVENSDFSDDYAYGGRGNDHIVAGGTRGVDRVYGDKENDRISVGPNSTKEIVDCGPGAEDWVRFDPSVDVIKNCEIKDPV
jgi:Ca2+-binding RTX toxin-like protein